jgi:enoyl-CoA hydratase/carnithine racemase
VGAAKDILLGGRTLTADEALRIGLVNQVFPPAELLDATLRLAERIANYAPVALASVKELLARIARDESDEDLAAAHAAFSRRAFASPDYNEGVHAFIEKRDRRAMPTQ